MKSGSQGNKLWLFSFLKGRVRLKQTSAKKCSQIFISSYDFLNSMLNKLPKPLRNFYLISIVLFLAWMLLLDSNNLISRFQLSSKLRSLENEKEYYEEKIKEVEKDHDELFGDQESLEKFAREKYLMKNESEDIYIVVEK
jgi:cell division protein DivIC